MKNIFIIALILFFYGSAEISQLFSQPDNRMRSDRRIEELARIKLIEALQLDEERSVRFFARRSEHIQKIEKLRVKKDELLNSIEKKLSEEKQSAESSDFKKLNRDFLAIEAEMDKERKQFVNSLSDILSEKEISTFLVFERNFQRELRNMLMQHRQRERGKR